MLSLPILRLVRQEMLPEARQVHEAEVLLGGMLAAFLAALGSAWIRGLDIACGCFGRSSVESHLWASMLLDLALLAALCTAGWFSWRAESKRETTNGRE